MRGSQFFSRETGRRGFRFICGSSVTAITNGKYQEIPHGEKFDSLRLTPDPNPFQRNDDPDESSYH
jgi:hypothetical protein